MKNKLLFFVLLLLTQISYAQKKKESYKNPYGNGYKVTSMDEFPDVQKHKRELKFQMYIDSMKLGSSMRMGKAFLYLIDTPESPKEVGYISYDGRDTVVNYPKTLVKMYITLMEENDRLRLQLHKNKK